MLLCGLLGRELSVLIMFGQSRPSGSKCIQLHAFLFSEKHGIDVGTGANAR